MKTILRKSLVVVAAVVLIVSAYFITGVLWLANAQYNDINAKNMEETAGTLSLFTPAIIFTDNDAAAEWISHFEKIDPAYRITLISRSGQVLFDTDADSSAMENHLDRREFQTAVREGIGSDRRRSATIGYDYFYTAAAIYDSSGQFAGVLRLSLLVPGFFSRLAASALPFLFAGFLIILGAAAGLYRYSRWIFREVEVRLNTALEQRTKELREKTAEAEAEGRYREVILNSMFEGLITLDGGLNIVFANPKICSLFGFDSEKNAGGMSLLQFSHSAELEEAARQVLAKKEPFETDIKRFVSGSKQHFQVFLAPLDSGVVMVLKDTSRLVKLEQVRKDFAANVSHELRTPIQVIHGFAETILDSPMDNKEQIRHFTGIIRKNAQSMENITNDLLTLVSLEDKDAARPPMDDCAIAPLISEAVDAVAIAAQNKNIEISVSCPQGLGAKVYSTLFVQALVNLLDNGVKYSEEGSPLQVFAFTEGEELVIEVKDKGMGIPAEHIDRIFERFYRVDRSRSRQTAGPDASEAGGTGLGLSIVRHIALLHRGTASVESHAGEGSVFRLRLPLL